MFCLALCLLCTSLFVNAATALPWLSVQPVSKLVNSTRKFIIVDSLGREVTLRGANVEQEERSSPPPVGMQRPIDRAFYSNGSCPQNRGEYFEPPICGVEAGRGKYNQSTAYDSRNDMAQLRALGFNFIRLCVSWSAIEPVPGVYDDKYVDRIEQLVDWAAEQDIYVLIDMHQDDYSLFIQPDPDDPGMPPLLVPQSGQDGAPNWAILAQGCPSWALFGVNDFNLAVMCSFESFWNNTYSPVPQGAAPGTGLQDHYIGAMAALVRRFVNNPAVVGYEIINEPPPGTDLWPWDFAANLMFPFYKRVIEALTGVRDGLPTCPATAPTGANCSYPDLGIRDTRHLIFVEPMALRNSFDFALEDHYPFTSYTNLVYSPHVYTNVFTIWSPPSYDFAYQTASTEAIALNAALVVTEFGCGYNTDATNLEPTLEGQEHYLVSGASLWSAKSNCADNNTGSCAIDAWTIWDPAPDDPYGVGPLAQQNGPLRPERQRLLSRVHSRGTVGAALATFYNVTDLSFFLHVNGSILSGAASLPMPVAATRAKLPPPSTVDGSGTRYYEVSTAEYVAEMPVLFAISDSVVSSIDAAPAGEVFIPLNVPWNVTVKGAARLLSVVAWPDGSRSAYIQPDATIVNASHGLYSVYVGPSGWAPPYVPPHHNSSAEALKVEELLALARGVWHSEVTLLAGMPKDEVMLKPEWGTCKDLQCAIRQAARAAFYAASMAERLRSGNKEALR